MRDKHERELDAILDSLYQAEVERDRANARCYRMYREWQTALRRAEAAEADQCDGADRCEKSHYAAMCREKWMVELKEKSAYILEMDDANEEREKVLGENVKKVKVLESQNVAMRIISTSHLTPRTRRARISSCIPSVMLMVQWLGAAGAALWQRRRSRRHLASLTLQRRRLLQTIQTTDQPRLTNTRPKPRVLPTSIWQHHRHFPPPLQMT
jgi:hypothetical protein